MSKHREDSIAIRRFKTKIKEFLHPFLLLGVRLCLRCKVCIIGEHSIPADNNVIFAVNHSNSFDFPVSARVVKRHFIILADATLQEDPAVNLLNRLNGCVYVDRKDRESRAVSKRKILDYLSDGKNILLFPEGTWNLHPCRLMLPLNWGIIDLSKTANVPIVPIVMEYHERTAYVKIGEGYMPAGDKLTEIKCLTDKMATMKWDLIHMLPSLSRNDLQDDYFETYVQSCLDGYRRFDFEYETSVIRKEYDTYDEVYEHLKYIHPTMQNAFLFNKRLK